MLIGNLVADPKLTKLQVESGETQVVNFTLAVNRSYGKNNTNETAFVNCEAWDTGAKHIAEGFKLGDRMFVQGSIKNERWEKDGQIHKRDKVRVSHFERVMLAKTTNAETPASN